MTNTKRERESKGSEGKRERGEEEEVLEEEKVKCGERKGDIEGGG